jgi:hypothetical protein
MKTKPFLLATAGSTVDGRTIDDAMLEQMVSSYNPKTYGARLNIEHVRGMTGDGPFRAFGDVLELSLGNVEVDFNGKKEQRTALFGTFDVTEDARKLNQAGQKVYPSIEIEPNFAGKGFAYLMGCALTDSPASIATQRLQFNRSLPGTLTVAGEEAALLEFAETTEAETGAGFLAGLSGVLDRFAAKFTPAPPKADPAPPADPAPAAALDFGMLRPLLEEFTTGLGKEMAKEFTALRTEFRAEADALAVKLQQLEATQENTPRTSTAPAAVRTDRPPTMPGSSRPGARPPSFQPAPHPVTTGPEHHGLQSFRSRAPGARRPVFRHCPAQRGRARCRPPVFARSHLRTAARGFAARERRLPPAHQRARRARPDRQGDRPWRGQHDREPPQPRQPPRQPKYVGHMQERDYLLKNTLFDTWLPWELIDSWSKFPDFPTRYARQVAISVALSRIAVGWHGIAAAADTDADANPLGEDVNVGWLQKLRLERADHVMGRETVTVGDVTTATGAAKPIYIGPDSATAKGDYKNIDALAYDLIAGMPSWARSSTDHVVSSARIWSTRSISR